MYDQFIQLFLSFLVLIIRTMGTINKEKEGGGIHTYFLLKKRKKKRLTCKPSGYAQCVSYKSAPCLNSSSMLAIFHIHVLPPSA